MLARQPESDDKGAPSPSRLKVVGDRALGTEVSGGQRRFAFFRNGIDRFRTFTREQPERYKRMLDRLIVVAVVVVLVVAMYILIVDPS